MTSSLSLSLFFQPPPSPFFLFRLLHPSRSSGISSSTPALVALSPEGDSLFKTALDLTSSSPPPPSPPPSPPPPSLLLLSFKKSAASPAEPNHPSLSARTCMESQPSHVTMTTPRSKATREKPLAERRSQTLQVKTAASSATAVVLELEEVDDDDVSALSFAVSPPILSLGRLRLAEALSPSRTASLRDLAANPRASLPRTRARKKTEEGD